MSATAAERVDKEGGAGGDHGERRDEPKDEVEVCLFDYSAENFSSAMRAISKLAGEPEPAAIPDAEVERFASMATFLKEWKHFSYEPKIVSFACEAGLASPEDDTSEIILPQFSSVAVPQVKHLQGKTNNMDRSDFILFAGGNVWALDWCPRVHNKPDSRINCEYLAVAAHPPSSTYHQIGMPLIGRGIIQIWCLVARYEKVEFTSMGKGQRSRGRPKKKPGENNSMENGSDQPKQRKRPTTASNDLSEPSLRRPRGRPRKCVPLIAVDFSGKEDTSQHNKDNENREESTPRKCRGRPRKYPSGTIDGCKSIVDLKEDTAALPTSTSVSCLVPEQKRRRGRPSKKKCRGRPRKNPLPSNANHIPDPGIESRKDTSLPRSGGCSTNDIECMDGCNVHLNVVSPDVALPVHFLPNANCEEEPSGRRGIGQPGKKPVSSELGCLMASDGEEQKIVSTSTISNGHLASVDNSMLLGGCDSEVMTNEPCSSGLFKYNEDEHNACLSIVSADAALPMHISPNSNREEQSNGRRGRGRPRKRSISSEHRYPMAFGVEVLKTASTSTTSNDHLASVENSMLLGGSNCEIVTNEPGSIDLSGYNEDKYNAHLSIVSADAALPMHLSPNSNREKQSSGRKGRGRPRKKPISSELGCLMASGVEVQKTASTPTVSDDHLASVENAVMLGGSKMEVITNEFGSIGSENKTSEFKAMKVDSRNGANSTPTTDIEKLPLGQTVPVPSGKISSLTGEMSDRDLTGCKWKLREEDSDMIMCPSNSTNSPIPKDIALPRVVVCLAHNGKVAWDVKWKPSVVNQSEGKYRLGYLATLLGNGSLEVWEVPSPSMIQRVYSSACREGTDPRFLKLQPVFRCANVKCGNRQSIPLTVEWSPSPPHDMILAGCHDGTVALWKFCTNFSSQDAKPLLCFNADSVPIRALSWAPYESSEENSSLFVTAGQDGLKFWDIRDPYRPLWELTTSPKAVLSLDWLNDARCLVISLEDGTLKFLSLSKSAYDVPVTGRPFVGKRNQGLFTYALSEFVIWSVHVSRTTGIVAYCVGDGTAIHFQLTAKFLEREPGRNRAPYFLCGSLQEKGKVLRVSSLQNTPLSNVPLQSKKAKQCRDIDQVLDVDKDKQANLADPGDDCVMDPKLRNNIEDRPDGLGSGEIVLAAAVKQEAGHNSRDNELIFPPKVVALHRVRWNMNKGSEKWLCYGGAAGIVRCQKISLET